MEGQRGNEMTTFHGFPSMTLFSRIYLVGPANTSAPSQWIHHSTPPTGAKRRRPKKKKRRRKKKRGTGEEEKTLFAVEFHFLSSHNIGQVTPNLCGRMSVVVVTFYFVFQNYLEFVLSRISVFTIL